jgi:ABC-type nitrate/sulfonate/bicarbonate transport system permease component
LNAPALDPAGALDAGVLDTAPVDVGVRRADSWHRRVVATTPILIGIGLLVCLWLIAAAAEWGGGMIVTPSAALAPVLGDARDVYVRAAKATVWSAVRGLAIGATLAFLAALVAATVPGLRRSIGRLAAIANAAPWVAVAPCLLVMLGRDRGPIAVAAIAVFFFVFVSTSIGLGAAPVGARDVAQSLGASRSFQVLRVRLPAAWPSVVDGLALAAPAALAGAVFGEWYGAKRGIGVLLITAMQGARADRLWAASLLAALCGLVAFAVLALVRRLVAARYGTTIATATTEAAPEDTARRIGTEIAGVVALVAVVVFAWWCWIEIADISPLVVPRPSAVWRDLLDTPTDYLSAAIDTLATAAAALLIGASFGLAAAFVASRSRVLAGMTVPIVVVLAATPLVALFPLFARVLGYQPNTVRAIASIMVFYPVFVYTRAGLVAATPATIDVADSLGAGKWSRFRLVELPQAVPHIASGLRIAAGSAVIAAVVGETLIGRSGLGVEFSYSYQLLQLPRAFGAAVVIVVVSVAVFGLAGWFERTIHRRFA